MNIRTFTNTDGFYEQSSRSDDQVISSFDFSAKMFALSNHPNASFNATTMTGLSYALMTLLTIGSVSSANLMQNTPVVKPISIMDVLREVTFHLDDDLFIEQVSFMRSHVNSIEAKEGSFTLEEMSIKDQSMSFKLFNFDLMNRLFEKTSSTNYTQTSQGELSIKVRHLSDLVVLMLQPVAFWIRMPLQRGLNSKLFACENINTEFQPNIDLTKRKILLLSDFFWNSSWFHLCPLISAVQKYLRSNQWYTKTISQKMDDSNRCVKHQLNRIFQFKAIFHRYLNHSYDFGYSFVDKFEELVEAINENCIEMHVEVLKEILEPIVTDDFDLNQIYSKEELQRQKNAKEAALAKRMRDKKQEEQEQQNAKSRLTENEEPEETSNKASRAMPRVSLSSQDDSRSEPTPKRRWRVDTKTRYEMTEMEGNLTKKHLEGSLEESQNGIIL